MHLKVVGLIVNIYMIYLINIINIFDEIMIAFDKYLCI